MRYFLLVCIFVSVVFADFFVVNHNKKTLLNSAKNAHINLADFHHMVYVKDLKEMLKIQTDEKDFKLKNLHLRFVSIYPKNEYAVAEKSLDTHLFSVVLPKQKNAKILQLFYKQKWYTLLLDKPIKILHESFASIDMKQKDLDIKRLQEQLKQARVAFPLDDKLKTMQMELNNRAANEFNKTSNHMQQGVIF
jgi:hypothetical protein